MKKGKMRLKVNKRHFLLLEVLIAFILIVVCMLPLITPHTFILTEQKKFMQQLEVDHLVNLVYADIVERLYRNEIPWNSIINGSVFEIDDFILQRIRYDKKLPYKGTYQFGEIIHKPTDESPKKLYVLKLDMNFIPEGKPMAGHETEIPGTLKYHYELFAVRDLGEGEPVEEEKKGDESEVKQEEKKDGGKAP
jgi:hypothetical protein